ncbi:MAG: sugar phosphate isomerase/epimerase [Clostridiales bacterium]|nr:sugar phosphate isomerase/epimerase [Clostridiales bacterium]
MKLATTTGDFRKVYPDRAEQIRALHRAGFRHIDLNLYQENTAGSDFMRDNWMDEVERLRVAAGGLGMDFVQAHAPDCNPLDFDRDWELQVSVTTRSLEVCAALGIPNCVYHAGWKAGLTKEEYFEKNMIFLKRMIPAIEKTGVRLLIENSTKANMRDCYYFFTGRDMKEFIEYASHPLLGACWDTGHANVEGHQYEDITALGEDLRALHFNDNSGKGDEHIMPYLGTMSVDEVMCGLRDIAYPGVFTFECDSSLRRPESWFGNRRRWKEERILEPQAPLYEAMERALYVCGETILNKYGYEAE